MQSDNTGVKFLVGRGDVSQEKASSANCYFTTIGLTLLTSDPLMFIVIMKGKKARGGVEMGLDPFTEIIGYREDKDYLHQTYDAYCTLI